MKKIIEKLKNISSLGVYVTFSIIVLIIYTIVSQYLAVNHNGLSLDTLTTCVFGFFGGEVVTCGLIKIFKLREEKNSKNIDGVG
mgnify:FL=1